MTDIAGERRATARVVKSEVEAIFGAAPLSGARASSKVQPIGVRPVAQASRAGAIGASVALALAGIAIGALLTRGGQPQPQPQPAPVVSAPASSRLEVVLTPEAPVTPLKIEPAPAVAPQPEPSAKPRTKATSGDCASPGGRRCTYSVVLAADSSLRKAYRRAGRAGVSGRELANYRAAWSRLRRAGARDPDRVVRGYRAMASDLNRLARERRA